MRNSVKHSLIILISLLFLSSPVIGNNHKGETLYRWDTSSGEVWKGFGDKDTNPVYKGEVKNGKPSGLGVITFPNGHKYGGEWKNGVRHGKGRDTGESGDEFVGEYKYGERNGKGTYFYSDGKKYEGEYKDGKPWYGTGYDKYGNIGYKVVNGKWIKQ